MQRKVSVIGLKKCCWWLIKANCSDDFKQRLCFHWYPAVSPAKIKSPEVLTGDKQMHKVHKFLNSSFFIETCNYIALIKTASWYCCACNKSVNYVCATGVWIRSVLEACFQIVPMTARAGGSGSLGLWFLVAMEVSPLAVALWWHSLHVCLCCSEIIKRLVSCKYYIIDRILTLITLEL